MKVCTKCGEEKDESQFSIIDSKTGKLNTKCRTCRNEVVREWYKLNREKIKRDSRQKYVENKERIKLRSKLYRSKNKDKIKLWSKAARDKSINRYRELKANSSCSSCGETHPACLEFHHVDPTTKEHSVSNITGSTNVLNKEIEKCIILCSNCHKKLHWQDKTLAV